jgi:putative hydrolase of HD superfamily
MTATHHLAVFCEQIAVLKQLPRTGWLQRGVVLPESITEHSFGVAALALVLGSLHPHLNQARVLELALVHDLGEAVLTDLPFTAQQVLGKQTKHEAEQRAVALVVSDLPNTSTLLALWAEYAAGTSAEARFVKALDRIELLAQALAYERAGNRNLAEFWCGWEAGWDGFPALAELATELQARRPHPLLHAAVAD